jgi:hypothetical protein
MHSRTDLLISVVSATTPPAETLRVLVSRPRADGTGWDLVLVTDRAGSPLSERTILEHWDMTFYSCGTRQCVIPEDSHGRLLLRSYDPATDLDRIIRVDPETGESTEIGRRGYFLLSPSRDRLAVINGVPPTIDLHEVDDRKTTFTAASGTFAGEDFVFIDDTRRFHRVRPQAAPEILKEGVVAFQMRTPYPTVSDPILLLQLVGQVATGASPQSLFNVATGEDHPLPFHPQRHWLWASSDGRWVYGQSFGAAPFFLFDVASGTEEVFTTPVYSYESEWRPGRAELWMVSADESEAGWIKRPGEPLVDLPARPILFQELGRPAAGSWFTPDGNHWFSLGVEDGGGTPVIVGNADDPAGPRIRANPDGSTAFGYWFQADGTLVVQSHFVTYDRSEFTVVDPARGTSRALAQDGSRGILLEVGERRALGIVRWLDGAGDLVVMQLDGRPSTKLAEDYVVAAYPERRGPDPLAPGTRVVFQFHNRFASPYDGLWMATPP